MPAKIADSEFCLAAGGHSGGIQADHDTTQRGHSALKSLETFGVGSEKQLENIPGKLGFKQHAGIMG